MRYSYTTHDNEEVELTSSKDVAAWYENLCSQGKGAAGGPAAVQPRPLRPRTSAAADARPAATALAGVPLIFEKDNVFAEFHHGLQQQMELCAVLQQQMEKCSPENIISAQLEEVDIRKRLSELNTFIESTLPGMGHYSIREKTLTDQLAGTRRDLEARLAEALDTIQTAEASRDIHTRCVGLVQEMEPRVRTFIKQLRAALRGEEEEGRQEGGQEGQHVAQVPRLV